MSAQPPPWTEHRTPEGRPYWYHTLERRSVWEKPSELKTPRERALEATPWKEYKSGDRSYYVHSVTKQSTWTLPAELKQILDQYPLDGAPAGSAAATPHVAGNPQSPALARSPVASQSPFPAMGPASPNQTQGAGVNSPNPMRTGASGSNTPLPATRAPPAAHQTMSGSTELNFKGDKEAAETAFLQLLADTGVDVDWTWETTMRSIITNPLYKALKTIAERKAAFHKHIDALRAKRAAEAAARREALLPAFRQLVAGDARIKSYSSYATARKFLGASATWKKAEGDDEARALFEAVLKERRDAEAREADRVRTRNKHMLMELLKTFEADVSTRWRDAHRTILESPEYVDDAHLRAMDLGDMLAVFDDLIQALEREADVAARRDAEAKRRRQRQNRDAYRALLRTLRDEGRIQARSTWGDVYPLLAHEPAFLNMAGQPGSTPLELFFDLVDELDAQLERQTADALQHIARHAHTVTPTTTHAEFVAWTRGVDVPRATLDQIYTELVAYLADEAQRAAADERRRLERKFRHQIEELRYAFKKVEPPLDLDAPWDAVVGRVQGLPEYREAQSEDARVAQWAWDKFVRRQKEKEREGFEGRKRKEREERGAGAGEEKVEETAKRVRREGDDDDDSEPEEGQV
ncbi:related to Formin binding protein 3 [Sporisorium reilianum SRZ2]|uniref:Related to Formin binding protein 3 n=1 Tax=Sporisorium reilianum (strain SRZ2) TaxID=999809 RepID=E6ZSD8_SPORE|nr:related to Formin binding protein 3 [Sporisorium reilianum SRZ2]